MKLHLFYIMVALLALTSCGGSKQDNAAVPSSDNEIEVLARNAARLIVDADRNDTLAVQTAIMEARAQRSAFAISGNEDGAQTYDEALKDELMRLDPRLCDTIFASQQ